MSESRGNDIFDVRRIRRLVELMHDNELTEMDLHQDEMRIRLRREKEVVAVAPIAAVAPVAAAPAAPAAPAASAASAEAAAADGPNIALIKSPMVGTFYTTPNPDSPAFVSVGDSVGLETPVCIVEAMKVFNEIQAEVAGKIVSILVKNGDPVEFDQPLFKVDTQG